MADSAALPNAAHIVVSMSDVMDLNILTRDDRVVLPRVQIEGDSDDDGDDDDDDDDEGLTPEQVAEMEEKLKDLIVKDNSDKDEDGEWEDEDGDDDVTPLNPRLECTIDAEHAPEIYKKTTVLDLEDLAFPNAIAGIAALAPNIETVRIRAVPSSGFLGEWPLTAKNLVVWHDQMNYEYGPYMDSDDEDSDEEDEEEDDDDDEGEEKAPAAEGSGAKDEDENDPDFVPDDDESDDEDETPLVSSRFVLNVKPSDAANPRVTKALEQMINVIAPALEELTVIFNVDKEYKQPKDYEPASDEEEPPLLLFLLTLLTMCGSDATKVTFVDFDQTGVKWLGDDKLPKEIDAAGVIPPEVAQAVFEEFLNGGIVEVREDAKADGLGDVGTKRSIKYLSRDEYKMAVGEELFKLHTQWDK